MLLNSKNNINKFDFNLYKNIFYSFGIKGLNIFIGLLLVPLTLNYLDNYNYGVWITLSSLVGWFGFFDIGLGHGLRNKLTEALAKEDIQLAQKYVSTTYGIIGIIIAILILFFLLFTFFVDWNILLNIDKSKIANIDLKYIILITYSIFCLSFMLRLITVVLTAHHKTAKAASIDLIGKLFVLIIIYILTKTSFSSLFLFSFLFSVVPAVILVMANFYFFNKNYQHLKPSFKKIDFTLYKDLMSLGLKFFFLQISAILIFETNIIVIGQLFGQEQVTVYNLGFKYFSIISMISAIVLTPYWSAFTEAWVKNDKLWIKKSIIKLNIVWILLVILALLMLYFDRFVFKIWFGEKVFISKKISILICIWLIIMAWNATYVSFFNGIGKVRVQMLIGIFAAITNIPLSVFFAKIYGIEGILYFNILLSTLTIFIYPIQYYYLINDKAKGLFNK
ncbi:polysaccharide biosynthesis protein [Flavobacterium branchiophilum NBRC 15030 = ATCC 35035]|uniref:Na+-driven multidrug efflux pump n=2 Tax=Flavobacterium branchiophilum TaxID=55197 RepID=A0A543G632_9FLAO|nr:polysaccharide biosynthesis protein [Flavobacterium branchiophilum NBRC 15030 = ATCC 35035]TQM41541.1 Na+-driven multidrug efflux pump [Flavobacterium branchiophilum]